MISGLYHSSHALPKYESVVEKWFRFFIEPHLDNCQFGCRKSRSTTHALIAILHTWMTALDSHDLVDHNILFTKLSKYNISNFLLLCFASYLTNRQQRVRVNSSVSTFKNLKGAMPQGSWLGPLAFLVLIDDLSTGCPLHKYVDDTTLSELVQPKELDTHILTYLADLLTWAALNGMEINTSKTKKWYLVAWLTLTYPCLISRRKPLKELLRINCLVCTLTQPSRGPPTLSISSTRQLQVYISLKNS